MIPIERLSYVRETCRNILGYPIIKSLESDVNEADLTKSLLRYYQAVPIVKYKSYSMSFQNELVLDIESIINAEFPVMSATLSLGTSNGTQKSFDGQIRLPVVPGSVKIYRDNSLLFTDSASSGIVSFTDGAATVTGSISYKEGNVHVIWSTAPSTGAIEVRYTIDNTYYFYLGLLGQDFKSNAFSSYSFDRLLLGTELGISSEALLDPTRRIATITLDHMLSGATTVEFRPQQGTKGSLVLIPKGIGSVSLALGFGYSSIDMVPLNHLEAYAGFVSEYYLERTISARSNVQIYADYQLSTTFLERKLDEIKQKNEMAIMTIATPIILWGDT